MNFTKLGGRRFVMAMGAGVAGTVLLWFGKLTADTFVELVKWTVSAYILGGTIDNAHPVIEKITGKKKEPE